MINPIAVFFKELWRDRDKERLESMQSTASAIESNNKALAATVSRIQSNNKALKSTASALPMPAQCGITLAMEAPMPNPSPATAAIVKAFDDRYELLGPFDDNWQDLCLAAAFRALAVRIKGADAVRQDILYIAAELDNS